MFRKDLLAYGCLVSAGLFLTACSDEVSTPEDGSVSEQLSATNAPAFFTVGEFEGAYNAETGEFTLAMLEPAAEDLRGDEFRTNRQGYGFCNDFTVNIAGGDIGANTVNDSIFDTVEDCIPADEVEAWGSLFYTAGQAFCVTVRVDNQQELALANVIAEITEITTGYEGYTYLDPDGGLPCCGTGADLSGLSGQNPPTDLTGGAFLHAATLEMGESGDQQWTLQNAGGSFNFRGRVVSQVVEVSNGLDDDCDGIIDNAVAEFADGADCREDADCESGTCLEIDEVSGFGFCDVGCEPGTFGPDCTPCTVDCSGNGVCDDGLSGTGLCICDVNWAGAACDDCDADHFGVDCADDCDPCGTFGTCSSGVAGDGVCVCEPDGYSAGSCEFSCANAMMDGDEEGIDCGGSCAACPEFETDCNLRGIPGAGIGLQQIVHEYGDDCDPISEDICLNRGISGVWYNEAEGETSRDYSVSPMNTVWTTGSCAAAVSGSPTWETFRNLAGGAMRDVDGWELCVAHIESLEFFDVVIDEWDSDGNWTYRRTGIACLCDAGFHGAECEFSCVDGMVNGDEEFTDCGGSTCDACPTIEDDPTLVCNFNGTFTGEIVDVDYEADDPCYEVSDGACFARSGDGGPPYNEYGASGHFGGYDTLHMEGTLWAQGTCGEVTPSSAAPFYANRGSNDSGATLGEWCFEDQSTGVEHTFFINEWQSSRSGDWAFTHWNGSCACDPGFHGGDCANSCSDGVQNGLEDQVDCGGPCDPCAEGWQCNFSGTAGGSVDFLFDYVTCDALSDGVCIMRGSDSGLYNSVTDTAWDWSVEGPRDTLWGFGTCDETVPNQTWRDAVYSDGDGPRSIVGEVFCVEDTTTGLLHEFEFTYWEGSRSGGGFGYTRTEPCECDPGVAGFTCDVTCSDGILNGDEDQIDCGGDLCEPCETGWECNFNGTGGDVVEFVWDFVNCDVLSDGVCIARGTSQGLYNTITDSSWDWSDEGPEGTRWGNGSCADTSPAMTWRDAVYDDGDGPRDSLGETYCVLDTTTGELHEFTTTEWVSNGAGGGFAYDRRGECVCDAGFHGWGCVNSCSDGIQNGGESLIDCGGPCEPCPDNWECNFAGTATEVSVDVDFNPGDPCYEISDGLCLARNSGGPAYNSATGHSGGYDENSMEGSLWTMGACEDVVPSTSNPFLASRGTNRDGFALGEWCVLDESTGVRHTVTIDYWESGRTGAWGFNHTGTQCECDPGLHGGSCTFTCDDGIQNGDEDLVDCGGDTCEPCPENWQCDFLGTPGEEVAFEWDGVVCDEISPGVCLARGTERGLYNAATETAWNGSGPLGTLWSNGGCEGATPDVGWRTAVYADGDGPRSLGGETLCMLDESTRELTEIEFTFWEARGGGGFSYTRTSPCDCDAGLHGWVCEDSCSDGVQNGAEDRVDCGGPICEACPEGWECNYNGTPSESTEFVFDGATCDAVSDGVCIMRGTSQGLYNSVTDTAWDWSDNGPQDTVWSNGSCADATPSQNWRDAVYADGDGPSALVGETLCMVDSTTGIMREVLWTHWSSGRVDADGLFSYEWNSGCDCDPGTNGWNCEYSCSDGLLNGDEDAVDCGGDFCDPCPVNWECNYNGDFVGISVEYVQDGGDGTCDPMSDGVCITRGTSQGLYNSITDTGWDWSVGGPDDTGWDGTFPCGHILSSPNSSWRDAVSNLGIRVQELASNGADFCVLDETTDEEWTITFDSWQSGGGGDFEYTRSQHACECYPGFSGDYCEIED